MYDPSKPYKQRIIEAIRSTWETPYVQVIPGGPYPLIRRKIVIQSEVDHTDGIGTKGVLHWKHRTFQEAVQDALAMNLNDLAVARAIPYKAQNHLTVPADDHDAILDVVSHLSHECKMRKIALTGGETSIHNTMLGMDLSVTMTGFVTEIRPNRFCPGDVLIGLASSGVHSNGFTFIREKFPEMGREWTTPTRIYWDDIQRLNTEVSGMVHVAGGGFTRLAELVPAGCCVRLRRWGLLPVFGEIFRTGMDDRAMYSSFNCGMGMVISVPAASADKAVEAIKGEVIGEVSAGGDCRVEIESIFSSGTVKFE